MKTAIKNEIKEFEVRIMKSVAKSIDTVCAESFGTFREAYNYANEEALKAWQKGAVVVSTINDLAHNVCYTNVIDIKGVEHK